GGGPAGGACSTPRPFAFPRSRAPFAPLGPASACTQDSLSDLWLVGRCGAFYPLGNPGDGHACARDQLQLVTRVPNVRSRWGIAEVHRIDTLVWSNSLDAFDATDCPVPASQGDIIIYLEDRVQHCGRCRV